MNDELARRVTDYVADRGDVDVLLVSPDAALAERLLEVPGVELEVIPDAAAADDIALDRQAELGVVAGQLEGMSPPNDVALLCRLRDCNCSHILLWLSEERPTAQELLAIGFYRDTALSGDGRLFRYDRDEFFEPRQWNTPENWAHPENFHKNRW